MAGNILKVLLGFEDEVITDKYKLSCMVNKIGGTPDWPDCVTLSSPSCRLCGRVLPLVCQLYAPLASSALHRTLYLFACVSPGCWDQDDSWACLRCQWPDTSCVLPESLPPATTDWCVGAKEWGDADEDRANGNTALEPEWSSSDEEDQEGGDVFRLAGLSLDERNTDAAAGQTQSLGASAEIEGPEGEVVMVDTPVRPAGNLLAVLQDDVTSRVGLPEGAAPQFQAVFLATGEEAEEERPCGEHGHELLVLHRDPASSPASPRRCASLLCVLPGPRGLRAPAAPHAAVPLAIGRLHRPPLGVRQRPRVELPGMLLGRGRPLPAGGGHAPERAPLILLTLSHTLS